MSKYRKSMVKKKRERRVENVEEFDYVLSLLFGLYFFTMSRITKMQI